MFVVRSSLLWLFTSWCLCVLICCGLFNDVGLFRLGGCWLFDCLFAGSLLIWLPVGVGWFVVWLFISFSCAVLVVD